MTLIDRPLNQLSHIWHKASSLFTIERILVLSFLVFIFVGTGFLMLPQATHGQSLNFTDALFSATSATCVTGLVVVSTGTKFTLFGQLIILIMIQVGGLGLMTFATAFLYLIERRLSLRNRDILQETLAHGPMPNIKNILKVVIFATLSIEGMGVFILMLRFLSEMPPMTAFYYALFHSISAFCNAGFSLYPDSLIAYQNDIVVNLTIASLVVIGGLGFIVINEFYHLKRFRWKFISFHSRIVLATTLILIISGALLFFLIESRNSIENCPLGSKLFISFFQSISARTAGFNTIDLASLSNASLFSLIILMFIGASPSSCGGGIKTTTFAVLFSHIRARLFNKENSHLFYRTIPSRIVSEAISITFFAIICITCCTFLLLLTELHGISHQESRGLFVELLFESTSAFGTVGLSVGSTTNLTVAGRIIITLMMFIGRLGPLTIAMTVGRKHSTKYKYVEEKVLVG